MKHPRLPKEQHEEMSKILDDMAKNDAEFIGFLSDIIRNSKLLKGKKDADKYNN